MEQTQPNSNIEYLTDVQLAPRIGFAVATLRGWRLDGKGPPFVRLRSGRAIRYRWDEVQAWLAAQTVGR